MTITFPGADVKIQSDAGNIDPTWYGKLKQVEAALNGNAIGNGKLANNATSGFGFFPTVAGTPTGVPVAKTGFVPFVYDITANKLWIYNGVWKSATFT